MHITWIVSQTELGLCYLHVRWPVNVLRWNSGSGPVGLGKLPSWQTLLEISQQSIYNYVTIKC